MLCWQAESGQAEMTSKRRSITVGLLAYIGATLVFALQPLTAIWVTSYARRSFEKIYNGIRKDAQALSKPEDKVGSADKTDDFGGMGPAQALMVANGLYDMPEFEHIDSFCRMEKRDPIEHFLEKH
jgi:hypothetical protein